MERMFDQPADRSRLHVNSAVLRPRVAASSALVQRAKAGYYLSLAGAGVAGAGADCMGTRFWGAGGCLGEFCGVKDALPTFVGARSVMIPFSRAPR